jgi:hypothetical protein
VKLAIVFEVPDGQDDVYEQVARRMIERHAFAAQEKIKHWSFDVEMRPVAAVIIDTDAARVRTEDIVAALLES